MQSCRIELSKWKTNFNLTRQLNNNVVHRPTENFICMAKNRAEIKHSNSSQLASDTSPGICPWTKPAKARPITIERFQLGRKFWQILMMFPSSWLRFISLSRTFSFPWFSLSLSIQPVSLSLKWHFYKTIIIIIITNA